jgi:hypothetical protein
MRRQVLVAALTSLGILAAVPLHADSATAVIAISANVRKNCLISTTAVAYGAYDPVGTNGTAPLDATGTARVAGRQLNAGAETPSITRLEGSRWRGGRLWSWKLDLRAWAVGLPVRVRPGATSRGGTNGNRVASGEGARLENDRPFRMHGAGKDRRQIA